MYSLTRLHVVIFRHRFLRTGVWLATGPRGFPSFGSSLVCPPWRSGGCCLDGVSCSPFRPLTHQPERRQGALARRTAFGQLPLHPRPVTSCGLGTGLIRRLLRCRKSGPVGATRPLADEGSRQRTAVEADTQWRAVRLTSLSLRGTITGRLSSSPSSRRRIEWFPGWFGLFRFLRP